MTSTNRAVVRPYVAVPFWVLSLLLLLVVGRLEWQSIEGIEHFPTNGSRALDLVGNIIGGIWTAWGMAYLYAVWKWPRVSWREMSAGQRAARLAGTAGLVVLLILSLWLAVLSIARVSP